MERIALLLPALAAFFLQPTYGQVNCLLCYDQNDRVISGGVDLLANGGFEDPDGELYTAICPSAAAYAANVPGWTCTGGGTATYAALADDLITLVPEGLHALYLGNSYCTVCPGTSSANCLLPGCVAEGLSPGHPFSGNDYGGTTGVSVAQTVTGLVPGAPYILEFWAGGEGLFAAEGLFAVDVGFGKSHLRCASTPPLSGAIGRRYVVAFTASGPAHTIRFTNWGHITAQSTEVVLDDIRLFAEGDLPVTGLCTTAVPVSRETPARGPWPSPFTDVLHLDRGGRGPAVFNLCDAAGRVVIARPFNGSISLSVGHLAPGIYTYRVDYSTAGIERGVVIKR